MKRDLSKLTLAADTALKTLTNPHHRRIALNYRTHAMLEVSGRWEEIFAPNMTVAHPFYRLATPTGMVELDGAAAVRKFYKSLADAGTTIMMLEHESLIIDDWGIGSEALYNTYMTGTEAIARGHKDIDPNRKYVEQRWTAMLWPYDEQARMIGERVYPQPTMNVVECPEDEFLTVDDANRIFAPLIAEGLAQLEAEALELV